MNDYRVSDKEVDIERGKGNRKTERERERERERQTERGRIREGRRERFRKVFATLVVRDEKQRDRDEEKVRIPPT